jgi:hypothetical protein
MEPAASSMIPFVLVFLAGLAVGGVLGHSGRRQRECILDAISPSATCPLVPPAKPAKLTLVRSEPTEKRQ